MMFLLGFVVGLLNAILILVVSIHFRKGLEMVSQSLERKASPRYEAEIIMPISKQALRAEEVKAKAVREGRDWVSLEEIYANE